MSTPPAAPTPTVPTWEDAVGLLTAPGAPFEIVTETVLGEETPVFKQRFPHLRAVLERSTSFGDAEFSVWDTGERWTFTEHERLVASVARAFAEKHGIGHGSRVAILAANCPEWVLAAWATLVHGGVVVAMNGWWTGDEIRYGLELGEPELLIADRKRLDRLEGTDPGVPTVVIDDPDRAFDAYQRFAPEAKLPDTPIAEDDPAALMFTSGTTGRPKGAVVSHRNFVSFMQISFCNGAAGRITHPIEGEPPPNVGIASAPLFHVSGFQACALMGPATGGKYVWTTGRFDPAKIMRLTLEEGVTRWGGITTQLWRLVEDPGFEPEKFRQVTSTGGGGSTFSPELQRTLREKLPQATPNFSVGYGMTECGGLCATASNEMLAAHPDTIGRPLPTAQVAILDDDGKPLPDGAEGNICIRGAMVMLEYFKNPEATRETLVHGPGGGRWLKSGDIGRMEDGLLFLASRKRDMIIRGGENIYPIEIENRLEEHPAIAEAAVVGVDHRTLGQEVKAFVVLADGIDEPPGDDELKNFVAETLAYYKVPEYIEVRSEALPRNASGKVLKPVLLGEIENTFQEE